MGWGIVNNMYTCFFGSNSSPFRIQIESYLIFKIKDFVLFAFLPNILFIHISMNGEVISLFWCHFIFCP